MKKEIKTTIKELKNLKEKEVAINKSYPLVEGITKIDEKIILFSLIHSFGVLTFNVYENPLNKSFNEEKENEKNENKEVVLISDKEIYRNYLIFSLEDKESQKKLTQESWTKLLYWFIDTYESYLKNEKTKQSEDKIKKM